MGAEVEANGGGDWFMGGWYMDVRWYTGGWYTNEEHDIWLHDLVHTTPPPSALPSRDIAILTP